MNDMNMRAPSELGRYPKPAVLFGDLDANENLK